jgi:hypothetical protein
MGDATSWKREDDAREEKGRARNNNFEAGRQQKGLGCTMESLPVDTD